MSYYRKYVYILYLFPSNSLQRLQGTGVWDEHSPKCTKRLAHVVPWL